MHSKDIIFKKFNISSKYKKKIYFLLKQFSNDILIKSFSKDYVYNFKKSQLKKYKKFQTYTIIGMGGSSLGIEAIYSFFKEKIKKKFYFKNNLNSKKINLNKKNKNLNIIISKSGNTLETITNLNQIQDKNSSIFICENSRNYLRSMAKKLKCEVIDHNNFIGGRYSILSEVGMLPSILMGLDERKFKNYNNLIKNKKFLSALVDSVSSTLFFVKKNKLNSIILNYDEDSENLFKWYQQLIAESLGKKSFGITPIISTMPKDNHSMMQLYLDGPKNSFYTFFDVIGKKKKSKNKKTFFFKTHKYLNNKSLEQIKSAQKEATKIVFKKKNIPFRAFDILKRSESSIGEIFTFFMLETILIGKLLKINPFDQPSVELIKRATTKILKQ